ncbi:MAG: CorA family divalent cation transporter [Pseudobdellovibrionaceae bacterium]
MITLYWREEGKTLQEEMRIEDFDVSGIKAPFWIDLKNPTDEATKTLEDHLKIDIPTKKELWKNHVLNRQYIEDGCAFMTAAIINKMDKPYPETGAITFIVTPTYLLTVRDINPTSFKNFCERLTKGGHLFDSPSSLLEGLMEEVITRVAHNSEIVVDSLDDLSHTIFGTNVLDGRRKKNTTKVMKEVLRQLGETADLNSKISESLHSVSRLLMFYKQAVLHDKDSDSPFGVLVSDVQALTTQTNFLSDKITFQLDATLGMVQVEQNMISKMFSVFTVFFLPPTLVAGIYGMNFNFMPELEWLVGYPLALVIMGMCALSSYLYFRKRGWL